MALYFEEYEFACPCCGEIEISPLLIAKLDVLRRLYGHPIHISSGYRCEAHHREIGGVIDSQHVEGNASDIWVDGDYEKFHQLVLRSNFFDAVGSYPSQEFVHVDIRNDGSTPNYYIW